MHWAVLLFLGFHYFHFRSVLTCLASICHCHVRSIHFTFLISKNVKWTLHHLDIDFQYRCTLKLAESFCEMRNGYEACPPQFPWNLDIYLNLKLCLPHDKLMALPLSWCASLARLSRFKFIPFLLCWWWWYKFIRCFFLLLFVVSNLVIMYIPLLFTGAVQVGATAARPMH